MSFLPKKLLLIVAVAIPLAAMATDRVKRTMEIHRVSELGLEIWTEEDPKWDISLEMETGTPVLTAETPASHYPPAGMTWAVPGIAFTKAEFSEGARGALDEAARRYGLTTRDIAALSSVPATYGDLEGFETTFAAVADQTPVDVKVFFGHRPGKPAVAMQAFTLRGKLPHISEQIRRSWTNTRYLGGTEASE